MTENRKNLKLRGGCRQRAKDTKDEVYMTTQALSVLEEIRKKFFV